MTKNSASLFKKEIIVIPLLSIIFTLLLTWPLLLNITTYIPANGDGVVESWIAWWVQHAILTGKIFNQTLFFNGPQFYPLPFTIAYSDNLFLLSLLFAPLYWITNNISFWINTLTLFTFVFTFCSSYYAIRKLTQNSYASIIGAFIFTYNPITFAHYEPGHINLLSKYFLFLEFYFGFLYISKPSLKNSLLFFLFFTLNSLSSIYYEIFSILNLPIFFLPFVINNLFKKNYLYFKRLLLFSLSIIIFLPVLFYFNMPYLQFSKQENVVRELSESIYYSAQPIDFLASLPINLVYGPFVRSLDSTDPPKIIGGSIFYYGHTLSFDIVPIVLSFIGLVYLFFKWKKAHNKILFFSFSFVFIFSLLMMFGPYLQISSDVFIKLPYYYLYYYLPIPLLQSIRAPGRFEFLLYIPFSLLATYGSIFLLKRIKCNYLITTGSILFLLILENINITNYSIRNPELLLLNSYKNNQGIHTILDNKILLNYPNFDPNQNSEEANYLLWSTFFNARIMNGDTGYLPSDLFSFINNLDITKINDLIALKVLGVQDIIIHKSFVNSLHLNMLYSINKNLIVYQDNNIIILSLNKLQTHISYCGKNNMQYSLIKPKYTISQQLQFQIAVTNPNSCYEVNKYQDRYVETHIRLNGKIFTSYLQFPPVIGPYKNIVLNENIESYQTFDSSKIIRGELDIANFSKKFIFTLTQ